MVGNRTLTATYWIAGFVLAVLAGVGGAAWGNSMAPTFENEQTGGTPATGASRLMFSVFGGLLAGALVLAIFAAIFMFLWVRDRRAQPEVDDEFEGDEGFLDEIEFGDDSDDELADPHDRADRQADRQSRDGQSTAGTSG